MTGLIAAWLSPLEMLMVTGAVALVLVRWLPPGIRRPAAAIWCVGFVLAGAGWLVLAARWQLAPVLVAGAVALPFALLPSGPSRRRPRRPASRGTRWLVVPGTVACLAVVAAGPMAAWVLPVPRFPEPSGGYAVGTRVLQWTDRSRAETATANPDDRRTVVVQVWYPAAGHPEGARLARYLGRTAREARTVADGLARYAGLPSFVLDGVPTARTRSVVAAPMPAGGTRFPVVLFSPGLGGVRTQNTAWAEDLASHGYVVAALDHPYDSAAVVLSGGRTVRTEVSATGDPDADARRAADWTRTRASDLGFALTRLGALERGEGPLAGRLDTGRTATVGHSLGGAAALLAAQRDRRVDAVIDLDGFPHAAIGRPFRQPVLALTHEIGPDTDPDFLPCLTPLLRRNSATSYRLSVPDTAHLSFTDAPLYLPPVPSLVGSRGRTGGPRITAAVSVAFLDGALPPSALRPGAPRPGSAELDAVLSGYGDLHVYRPPAG